MKPFISTIIASLGLAIASPSFTQDISIEANILTGGTSGTYIQIGRDISAVSSENNIDLIVNPSNGSLENIYGVYERRATQFGIVQSDVLDFMKNFESEDPEIQEIIKNTRIAIPLYNEEIHIVVKPSVDSIEDFTNLRVATGADNSGTQLTASLVLDAIGITPKETLNNSPAEALELFLNDEVDAFFYVGGAPLKLLTDERLTAENAKLLSISNETLSQYYVTADIPANTYPWQTEATTVNAVKAVLMTYDFSIKDTQYFKDSCQIVTTVTASILANFEELQSSGHAKWKNVDLSEIPPGWERGKCVEDGIERAESGTPIEIKDCSTMKNPITKKLCETQQAE